VVVVVVVVVVVIVVAVVVMVVVVVVVVVLVGMNAHHGRGRSTTSPAFAKRTLLVQLQCPHSLARPPAIHATTRCNLQSSRNGQCSHHALIALFAVLAVLAALAVAAAADAAASTTTATAAASTVDVDRRCVGGALWERTGSPEFVRVHVWAQMRTNTQTTQLVATDGGHGTNQEGEFVV
jgi:hypothetical protein